MAERWTEERLDDLKGQVEKLERRTDAGFRELRQEMDRRFDKVDGRFEAIERRFDLIDGRFEAIHRTLILFLASMFAAMIGLVATLVATQH